MAETKGNIGKVVQVIGPVVDVVFRECELPTIHTAIRITNEGFEAAAPLDIIVEVEQHIGEDKVRCVSMHPTDGLSRGMKAVSLGVPIEVPVGEGTLGRVLNVIGEPVDNMGPVVAEKKYSIHRVPPPLEDQSTRLEIFETGIKVIDLIQPFLKGGKIGLFGGAGRREDHHHPGAHPQRGHEARRRLRLRRRRRADARRQRPLARDEGHGRHQQDHPGLRPDDRAAGRAAEGRADRPVDGRVLPRRARPGHPPVHRQHLPVRPGGRPRSRPCWAGCPRPSATSPTWPPSSASSRSGSPRPRRGPSPRSRPSTSRPTISPTPPRRRPSPTWTPRPTSTAA